tara:strand:+ start:682 stop:942 length:261 start_codon:yes stop_codon:yes gene_type:complete
MENKEMIYTAIYQNSQGKLTYDTYNGHMSRQDAWLEAAKIGGTKDLCLVALVPGVHPVYFYSDFVESVSAKDASSEIKSHDLFELT